MYNHADQSWRKMPVFLSNVNEDLLAFRIAEYVEAMKLDEVLVIYHGGEPLLIGIEAIERITQKIKSVVSPASNVAFSIQTNGTLISEENLDRLERLNISVSLSIDGPAAIHDKHRVDHGDKPSFNKVDSALKMLLNRPNIFSGVIAVIDPEFPPSIALEYFNSLSLTNLDFLLPDANYNRLPPGKEQNPSIYTNWLIECFNLWFNEYPHIRIRFFEAILDAIVGLPSKTDSLGFGDVSLITIETDGNYHDLDVLKIAHEGASNLNLGGLSTNTIEEALESPQIQKHRRLLTKKGLSSICQKCSIVDICAGGSVPHRYSNDGFRNPSIYCEELFGLITHAKKRVFEQLESEIVTSETASSIQLTQENLIHFEDTNYSYELLEIMLSNWGEIQKEKFKAALDICGTKDVELKAFLAELLQLPTDQFKYLSLQPSVYAWTNVVTSVANSREVTSIDGNHLSADYSYVKKLKGLISDDFDVQRINREDYWLRAPFGSKIEYEDSESTLKAKVLLDEAYNLIEQWDPKILKEIKLIAPELQFIKDLTAHPDKIVSFSDNSVPGALYVTIKLGEKFIESADLADSILHEYRHQKLYLLQRISDIVSIDLPLIQSPWREELRPPSGLYHAIYVFSFLRKFWMHLSLMNYDRRLQERATEEVKLITRRLQQGIPTIRKTRLTDTGTTLLNFLENDLVV